MALDEGLPHELHKMDVPGLKSSEYPTALLDHFRADMLDMVGEGSFLIHDHTQISEGLLPFN